jgi:DNA-binding PadR family transcriptional regulator
MGHHPDDEFWGAHRRFNPRPRPPGMAFGWTGVPPPFPPMPFVGFPFAGPRGRRGRGRMGRGMIRVAILILLNERPMHGYEMMTELEERTRGMWRPSPGSVYPTLAQLEDQGIVRSEEVEDKRTFSLTDEGRKVAQKLERKGAPWALLDESLGDEQRALHESLGQLYAAIQQIQGAGTDAQIAAATARLDEARKAIYRLLADDDS